MKMRFNVLPALPALVMLLTLPAAVQAQFDYTTNAGAITITGYTGPGGAVTIPALTNGPQIVAIGDGAFSHCATLTSVSIPDSVTSIGSHAFSYCSALASVTMGKGVRTIGDEAFSYCTGLLGPAPIPAGVTDIRSYAFGACIKLTQVAIPNSVTNLGEAAFWSCTSVTSVTIGTGVTRLVDGTFAACTSLANLTVPSGVRSLGDYAFAYCTSLTSICFAGNPPSLGGPSVFSDGNDPTLFYLPGTIGWDPQVRTGDASFGVRSNRFGFTIAGASGVGVVVEACADLARPAWSPLATNTFAADFSYFSDPEGANYPSRYYRLTDTTFGGLATALWNPQIQTGDAIFGVRADRFGFTITGASNLVAVVEACTNLAGAAWAPVATNTLTGGSCYFSDPLWTNYPACLYRLRSP